MSNYGEEDSVGLAVRRPGLKLPQRFKHGMGVNPEEGGKEMKKHCLSLEKAIPESTNTFNYRNQGILFLTEATLLSVYSFSREVLSLVTLLPCPLREAEAFPSLGMTSWKNCSFGMLGFNQSLF